MLSREERESHCHYDIARKVVTFETTQKGHINQIIKKLDSYEYPYKIIRKDSERTIIEVSSEYVREPHSLIKSKRSS